MAKITSKDISVNKLRNINYVNGRTSMSITAEDDTTLIIDKDVLAHILSVTLYEHAVYNKKLEALIQSLCTCNT